MHICYINEREYRNTTRLVNLTKRKFCIYEQSTGDIVALPCKKRKIPEEPHIKSGRCSTHYIVDARTADKLRASGRSLDDIAVLKQVDYGRGGAPIAYLVWGKDSKRKMILNNSGIGTIREIS